MGLCRNNTLKSDSGGYNFAFEVRNTIINIYTYTHDAQWISPNSFASDYKCILVFIGLTTDFGPLWGQNTVKSHSGGYNFAFEVRNTIINIYTDTHDAQWISPNSFASD